MFDEAVFNLTYPVFSLFFITVKCEVEISMESREYIVRLRSKIE
jgi:hypothetical protein